MIKRSGDSEPVTAVAQETAKEIDRGWADGPWPFHSLKRGARISRRPRVEQCSKMCRIDDYLVSGGNGSCLIFSNLDGHAIDTFIALVHRLFEDVSANGRPAELVAKTFGLKSARRQIASDRTA